MQLIRMRRGGFTLVEVLVTSGIVMMVVLGFMQAMNFTTRAVKSTAQSSDWTALVNLMRLSFSNADIATNTFVGKTLPYTYANAEELVAVTGAPPPTVFLKVNTPVNQFIARSIELKVSATNPATPDTLTIAGVVYRRLLLELEITADKVVQAGTTAVGGGSLYSGPKNGSAVSFSALVDPANAVFKAFSGDDAARMACVALGGFWEDPAPAPPKPRCQLSWLPLAINAGALGPPSDAAGVGQRVQLFAATPGIKSGGDYAIGIDANTLWMNAASDTAGRYTWNNNSGTNELMSLADSGLNVKKKITLNQTGGNVFFGCTPVSNTTYTACNDAGGAPSTCATASCPAGTVVVSGGGSCSAGGMTIKSLFPNFGTNSFTIVCTQQGVSPAVQALCCKQ